LVTQFDSPAQGGPVRVHAVIDTLGSGGAEFLLADFAAVAAGSGIELSVAALKPLEGQVPAADRLRSQGIEPVAVPVTRTLGPLGLRRVRAHLAALRPDLVHTHLSTADFLGGLAAKSLGIPSVATIHADWWAADERSERLRIWLATQARRHLASTVIAVSESARAEYLSAARDSPEHVTVVRNGIADRACAGCGAEVRRELGLDSDDLMITALSRLRPEKNFEVAIDAVTVLRERHPNVRLVIVGDGPHEDAVRRHAERSGIGVVLTGHREDPMAVLDATDVLLHPSRFDAFPTTVLEAMAASVPVVATAVGGILEIVQPGVTGVLVPVPPSAAAFADALAPLAADQSLRRRLGAAGRRRYEREFSARAWAGRVRAVYDHVLSRQRVPPLRPALPGSSSGSPRAGC